MVILHFQHEVQFQSSRKSLCGLDFSDLCICSNFASSLPLAFPWPMFNLVSAPERLLLKLRITNQQDSRFDAEITINLALRNNFIKN